MIQKISHTSVYVLDQDRAKKFYTESLGFDLHTDAKMGDFRWLTVSPKGQPDFELALMPLKASPMMDAESVEMLEKLVRKGVLGAGVLECADIQQTYESLKANGVVFSQPPTERPYGIEALLRDDSGNWFSLCQRKG
jgi:predicted enzyme related to lactoylglutathione lyase